MVGQGTLLLYKINITLKQPNENDHGFRLVSLQLENVKDAAFDGDTGTFYAVKDDGSMFMTPEDNIYNVWSSPMKEENDG